MIRALFQKPSIEKLAILELEEAEHALLQAKTTQDYANSLVRYNEDRVKRLRAYIKEKTARSPDSGLPFSSARSMSSTGGTRKARRTSRSAA